MQRVLKKSFILMIAAIVIVTGFGLTQAPASAITGPTSITVKGDYGTTAYSYVDYNGRIKVYLYSVYPSTRPKSVTWSVYSGGAYGKIVSKTSTYCYVQGIKYGTVTIKARSNYYPYPTKYYKVYVRNYTPSSVAISPASMNLWAGTSATLSATVYPTRVFNAGVNWSSSNAAVAKMATASSTTSAGPTVSGTLTAATTGYGTATITATTKELARKAVRTVNVYDATLEKTGRVTMEKGDTLANPVTVQGPGTIPAHTITYSSNLPDKISVDPSTGVVTAKDYGSATITARVTMNDITATNKVKELKYIVNVVEPVDLSTETSFDFSEEYAKLEMNSSAEGFLGDRSLLFTKQNLDDFFGFGALGVDLWNPMDMNENFFVRDIAWHIGGFTFDKVGTDVDVSAMIDTNQWFATYVLDPTLSLEMKTDLLDPDIYSGYDLKFFYTDVPSDGADLVTLDGNVLTIPFGGDSLAIERLGYNKIQVLADNEDVDSDLDNIVMTITRNPDGYHVVINDTTYMDSKGMSFNLYHTYL